MCIFRCPQRVSDNAFGRLKFDELRHRTRRCGDNELRRFARLRFEPQRQTQVRQSFLRMIPGTKLIRPRRVKLRAAQAVWRFGREDLGDGPIRPFEAASGGNIFRPLRRMADIEQARLPLQHHRAGLCEIRRDERDMARAGFDLLSDPLSPRPRLSRSAPAEEQPDEEFLMRSGLVFVTPIFPLPQKKRFLPLLKATPYLHHFLLRHLPLLQRGSREVFGIRHQNGPHLQVLGAACLHTVCGV